MSLYSKLYDWQKKIVDTYRSRKSFGLFLDMGLGKTPISLAFAEKNECTKILIVTINSKACEDESVSGSWLNWSRQLSFCYNFKTKYDSQFNTNENDIVLINYERLFKRVKTSITRSLELSDNVVEFINSCKGHNVAIIIDESHKMKNLQSQQTKSILKIKKLLDSKTNNVYTYLLSGTPFKNAYIDLYSQLKMLGYESTKGEFQEKFCERGRVKGLLEWQQPIVGYKNLEELFELVHQYSITIKSTSVITLPEQIFVNHTTKETESFKQLCDKKKDNPFYRCMSYPSDKWLADTSGLFWLRARQLSIGFQGNKSDFKWFDYSRLEQLKAFLKDNEDNYVLFYNYVPELIELYNICEELGYNIDIYSGEIKSMVFYERYVLQTDSEKLNNTKNIILSNFASGSTGMNWQDYNKCIIFSLPLYSDYEQALKRIHRIGSKTTVIYHVFFQLNWLDFSMKSALKAGINYNEKLFESDSKRLSDELNFKLI